MSYSTRCGGHIPEALYHFRQPPKDRRPMPLCEFASDCPIHRTRIWEPKDYRGIGTPYPGFGPFQIYHRTVGVIPNYGGHVPGEKLEFGKTFGSNTINARQWLYK